MVVTYAPIELEPRDADLREVTERRDSLLDGWKSSSAWSRSIVENEIYLLQITIDRMKKS